MFKIQAEMVVIIWTPEWEKFLIELKQLAGDARRKSSDHVNKFCSEVRAYIPLI